MPEHAEVAGAIARNVRRHRCARGWSLDQLAQRSGVSRTMLVQIEQERTNPTVWTLVRIGDALRVSVADLVESRREERVSVTRAGEATVLWSTPAGSRALLLAGSGPAPFELWEWVIRPGDVYRTEAHVAGVREAVTVVAGRLALSVGEVGHELGVGDAARYDGDVPHALAAVGGQECRVVMAVSVPDLP